MKYKTKPRRASTSSPATVDEAATCWRHKNIVLDDLGLSDEQGGKGLTSKTIPAWKKLTGLYADNVEASRKHIVATQQLQHEEDKFERLELKDKATTALLKFDNITESEILDSANRKAEAMCKENPEFLAVLREIRAKTDGRTTKKLFKPVASVTAFDDVSTSVRKEFDALQQNIENNGQAVSSVTLRDWKTQLQSVEQELVGMLSTSITNSTSQLQSDHAAALEKRKQDLHEDKEEAFRKLRAELEIIKSDALTGLQDDITIKDDQISAKNGTIKDLTESEAKSKAELASLRSQLGTMASFLNQCIRNTSPMSPRVSSSTAPSHFSARLKPGNTVMWIVALPLALATLLDLPT